MGPQITQRISCWNFGKLPIKRHQFTITSSAPHSNGTTFHVKLSITPSAFSPRLDAVSLSPLFHVEHSIVSNPELDFIPDDQLRDLHRVSHFFHVKPSAYHQRLQFSTHSVPGLSGTDFVCFLEPTDIPIRGSSLFHVEPQMTLCRCFRLTWIITAPPKMALFHVKQNLAPDTQLSLSLCTTNTAATGARNKLAHRVSAWCAPIQFQSTVGAAQQLPLVS